MKDIGIFTFLIILAACRENLANSPSSTPTSSRPYPTYPSRIPARESSRPDQKTAMLSGRTSSLFPGKSVRKTSTSNGKTSTSIGQTSPSIGQTSPSNGQTLTSSAGPTPAPVPCGPVPSNIYRCVGLPKLVKPEWGQACSAKHTDMCEQMTCVYEKAGWIKNGVIQWQDMASHFAEVSKSYRQREKAVKEAIEVCISEQPPPQGVYLKCPAYDITKCIERAFVMNTPDSQWMNSVECQETKRMARSCPLS